MMLNNLEAEILVDGKPATEYRDEDFEQDPVDDAASRFIEAVEGARFEIRCTVPPKYELGASVDFLSVLSIVDGVKVMSMAVPKEQCRKQQPTIVTRKGFVLFQGGRELQETFRFSKFNTYEGVISSLEASDQAEAFQRLGEILVVIKRQRGGKTEHMIQRSHDTTALSNKSKALFHEKIVAKTALSLAVLKDAPVACKQGNHWIGIDADSGPIASFTFKYRCKEGLQKLGIIERTPTPLPPVAIEDRDPATLTQEELVEVVRRVQAREQERQIKIKREARDANLRQLGVYKREYDDGDVEVVQDGGLEIANKRRKTEVIDLSD